MWTVVARVLLPPASSTNDGPRIEQKCPGKTLEIQQISPLMKNVMFFANRKTPPKTMQLFDKNASCVYRRLKTYPAICRRPLMGFFRELA